MARISSVSTGQDVGEAMTEYVNYRLAYGEI